MIISNQKYLENGSISATIDGQKMFIPDDMSNRFRLALAEEEAKGNAIAPYVAPPKQLQTLEPYQFYAALEITGNKEKFGTAWTNILASLDATGGIVAQAKLDHTKQFRPDNDLVLNMKAAMGLSDAEFKTLWETGESIA